MMGSPSKLVLLYVDFGDFGVTVIEGACVIIVVSKNYIDEIVYAQLISQMYTCGHALHPSLHLYSHTDHFEDCVQPHL